MALPSVSSFCGSVSHFTVRFNPESLSEFAQPDPSSLTNWKLFSDLSSGTKQKNSKKNSRSNKKSSNYSNDYIVQEHLLPHIKAISFFYRLLEST